MSRSHRYGKKTRKIASIAVALLMGTGLFMPAGHAAGQGGDSPTVVVSQYRFSGGQELATDSDLAALLDDSIGKPATIKDLEQQADSITRYLRSKGYFVAFAYIPAQDFANGQINIAIEPGRYDQVIINNETKIHDNAIKRELGKVASGAIVEKRALNGRYG